MSRIDAITRAIIRRVNKLASKDSPHGFASIRLPMAIDANERRDSDLEWNHFSSGRRMDGRTQRVAKEKRNETGEMGSR